MHERLQKFLQGWAKLTFHCRFQVADHTMQMDVHITLYPFYITKKMPHVTATLLQMRFFGSSASFHTV